MAHDLVTELLQYSSLACFMPIWQLCANLLIPNCLRSNLSYSPLDALELYVNINNSNIISRIGRVNSIHIYIVHWVLIEILFRIGNDVSPYLYFLSPLIIFFVSYVLSETYLKILVNRFPTKCKK